MHSYLSVSSYMFAAPHLSFFRSIWRELYSRLALSLVTGVAAIPNALLAAQKKMKIQYVISTVQPIMTIGLLVVLIPLYGIMGAIIALLLSRLATIVTYIAAVRTL